MTNSYATSQYIYMYLKIYQVYEEKGTEFKTESTRKLSNCNFQWTKTKYTFRP